MTAIASEIQNCLSRIVVQRRGEPMPLPHQQTACTNLTCISTLDRLSVDLKQCQLVASRKSDCLT